MENPHPGYLRTAAVYTERALIHSVVDSLQDVQDAIIRARFCADGLDEALDRLFAHLDAEAFANSLPG